MLKKDSLIFIIEDDVAFGNLLQCFLEREGFENVEVFNVENKILNSIDKKPDLIIADYHLKYTSGIKLIQKIKESYSSFRSILLSGAYHIEKYTDEVSVNIVDKYLKKSNQVLDELIDILNSWCSASSMKAFFY